MAEKKEKSSKEKIEELTGTMADVYIIKELFEDIFHRLETLGGVIKGAANAK